MKKYLFGIFSVMLVLFTVIGCEKETIQNSTTAITQPTGPQETILFHTACLHYHGVLAGYPTPHLSNLQECYYCWCASIFAENIDGTMGYASISGIQIDFVNSNNDTTTFYTDDQGHWFYDTPEDLPAGDYTVTASHDGYYPETQNVTVAYDDEDKANYEVWFVLRAQ